MWQRGQWFDRLHTSTLEVACATKNTYSHKTHKQRTSGTHIYTAERIITYYNVYISLSAQNWTIYWGGWEAYRAVTEISSIKFIYKGRIDHKNAIRYWTLPSSISVKLTQLAMHERRAPRWWVFALASDRMLVGEWGGGSNRLMALLTGTSLANTLYTYVHFKLRPIVEPIQSMNEVFYVIKNLWTGKKIRRNCKYDEHFNDRKRKLKNTSKLTLNSELFVYNVMTDITQYMHELMKHSCATGW